jgi:hypothetical protein
MNIPPHDSPGNGQLLSGTPDKPKRQRRTKARVEQLNAQIVEALERCHPNSVRHCFYLMTDPRLAEAVEKSERGARHVQERMVKLRRSGRLPYHWVVDMSRRGYHVATYGGASDFLRRVSGLYRADLWRDADFRAEVWCESRSIAGVILPVCQELAVSLYPAGGNSSISFAYQAAVSLNETHRGRKVFVFYVGDLDRAGVIADVALERELRLHLDPAVDLTFCVWPLRKNRFAATACPPSRPRRRTSGRNTSRSASRPRRCRRRSCSSSSGTPSRNCCPATPCWRRRRRRRVSGKS